MEKDNGIIKFEELDEDNYDEAEKDGDKRVKPEWHNRAKKPRKPRKSPTLLLIVIAIVAIAVAVCFVCVTLLLRPSKQDPDSNPNSSSASQNPKEEQVITVSTLEEIVETAKLSTYEMKYEGVATRYNDKKTNKVDYYVLYTASVKSGIEFDKIEYAVDSASKHIVITLPEIEIADKHVDKASLEYLFYNNKLNNENVAEEAYTLCTEDLDKKIKENTTIYEIATQNTKNTIEALVQPFIENVESDYTLEIRTAS